MSVMQLHVPGHQCRASASLPAYHFARHHDPLRLQQPHLKLAPPTAIAEDCHEQEGQDHEPFREKVVLRSTRMVRNAFCKTPHLVLHRQLLSSCTRAWAAQSKSAMNCSARQYQRWIAPVCALETMRWPCSILKTTTCFQDPQTLLC